MIAPAARRKWSTGKPAWHHRNGRAYKDLALGWDQESAPPDNIHGRTRYQGTWTTGLITVTMKLCSASARQEFPGWEGK